MEKIKNVKDSNLAEIGTFKRIDVKGNMNVKQEIRSNAGDQELILPNEDASFYLYLGRLIESFIAKYRKIALPIIITLPILSGVYIINYFWLEYFRNTYLIWTAIIIIILSLGILDYARKRKCKKCGRNFAYEEIERKQVGYGKHKGLDLENIKVKYRCKFCNNKYEYVYAEE